MRSGSEILTFTMGILAGMPDAKTHPLGEPVARVVGTNGRDDDTHPDLRTYREALLWNVAHRRLGPQRRFVTLGTGRGRWDGGTVDIAAGEWIARLDEGDDAIRGKIESELQRPRLTVLADKQHALRVTTSVNDCLLTRNLREVIERGQRQVGDDSFAYPPELGGIIAALLLRELTDPAPF